MLSAYAIALFQDNKKVTAKAINPCSDCILSGDPGGIRTPDPRLRRPLLYPTELLIRIAKAGDENRTHVFSLEG